MRLVFSLVVFGALSLAGNASAQDDPPAPCGPKGDLGTDLSTNVAMDSRCFELRIYTAESAQGEQGGIDNLHQRFREGEVALFEKHGAEVVAVWQKLDDPNTLVWMLAYKDRAHRDQVFTDFREDPNWAALRSKYEVPLANLEAFMMSASDYSALK